MRRARLFADYSDFVRLQGGEFLTALRSGAIEGNHLLGNIGDVLDGRMPGRQTSEDITVYKSLGLIAQDIAFSHQLVQKAFRNGVGTSIPFVSSAR